MRGWNLFDSLTQDLGFTLRQLRKNPGFTATAILMLALGICASISIFAFVDAALIRTLPYTDPNRLLGVYEHIQVCDRCNLSYMDFKDWKRLNKTFSSFDAFQGSGFILTSAEGVQLVPAARVSAGFFHTLGIAPSLGRDFRPGEDKPGAPRTVVLSHSAWIKRYGARPGILGQSVTLDNNVYQVIGVAPAGFHFAPVGPADYWVPLDGNNSCEKRRSCHNLYGIARLRDGVSMQTAQADVSLIAAQLEKQYPDSNREQGALVVPLNEVLVGGIRPVLLMLLGGAGLLLLIACVNVASLLLVRAESRRREMAVRSALGASRARLIRQFVTEGLVLMIAATVLGFVSASWTMRLMTRLIPTGMLEGMPFLENLGLNGRVFAIGGIVAIAAAALFSLTPALRMSFDELREGLSEGSRGSAGVTWRRLGSKLVVVELATAMVLLVGAGLLGQSLYRLLHVELRFEPDHLATLMVGAPDATYGKDPQSVALARRILTRISSIPGVTAAGTTSVLPVSYNGNTDWIRFVGRPYDGKHNEVNEREVSAGYFHTIGAKLLRGRYFNENEDDSKPRVAIINQALARKYYPGEDPIGKVYGDTSLTPKSLRQIVGIVDDIREGSLDSEIWPAEYLPFNQNPGTFFALLARTSQSEESVLPALTGAIRDIDRNIVTFDVTTIPRRIHNSTSAYMHRSSAWLVGCFAALALLLGVVGLYGVIAYSVSQRTREIGVRMALGAQTGSVYALILKEAGWLTAAGIGTGLLCALGAAALMRKLLFGVQSWDVPTLIGVAGMLSIAALAASFIPARRAASVNPVDALRAE